MPSTLIYLIRHAETTWNAEGRLQGTLDAPLSDRGRRQVRHLVDALRPVPLAALYSSPLQRAQETARPLSAAYDLPLRFVDELREMNQGAWEGRLVDDLAAEDGERLQAWRGSPAQTRLPGGESLTEVQERAMRAFEALAARHRGDTIAVVAHGGVNKTILLTVLGAPLGHHWRIKQSNACINVLEVGGPTPRILALNQTLHLGLDV